MKNNFKLNFMIAKVIVAVIILLTVLPNIYSQESWTATSGNNAPSPRWLHTAVWTGDKMIVWGGQSNYIDVKTGGKYDVLSNSWISTDTVNAPEGREVHTAIWTGSKMIIWGGWTFNGINLFFLKTGAAYDPVTNSWEPISTVNAPTGRIHHTAVWTGNKMIVWGGGDSISRANTGGIYDPVNNTWTSTSTVNAPSGREWHTAVWTGSKMIVWGGDTMQNAVTNTGGIYDPVQNTWVPTSITNAPAPRLEHSAVWTGDKMIVWGGVDNNGGIYDPVSDSWTPTSIINAPSPRFVHTATWTGIKMIVWGGIDFNSNLLRTGGIYDPLTDSWSATTIVNAPLPRMLHTAFWTGEKFIVWGGPGENGLLNSGSIYSNPSIISIENLGTTIPKEFRVYQNYPNPFNPSTTIKFDLPKDSRVSIYIYDILGKEIAVLSDNEFKNAGSYIIEWNAANFSSGVYFYRIEAGGFVVTKSMILVK